MAYSLVERGSLYSSDYRIYFQNLNGPISPLHDIPLMVDNGDNIFNMVVEIPRWTNAKMEISTKEILNPIKQDVKEEKPKFVKNCFPHHGYIWNYGALPQTWTIHKNLNDGTEKDNNPIEVIEIGCRVAQMGDILQVKILGALTLIDKCELDWKLIAIDIKDPMADQVNDITDIEKHFPGLVRASVEWFQIYKSFDKPEKKFVLIGAETKPATFALKIIDEVHQFWKCLVNKEVDTKGVSCVNTTIEGNSFKISMKEAKDIINKTPVYSQPQKIDSSVNKWHYVYIK